MDFDNKTQQWLELFLDDLTLDANIPNHMQNIFVFEDMLITDWNFIFNTQQLGSNRIVGDCAELSIFSRISSLGTSSRVADVSAMFFNSQNRVAF